MSNVIAFNPAQLPAHLKTQELSAATKALMGSSSGFRLSIKGGVFRLLSNGKEYEAIETRSLDVVVVAAAPHVARTFYMQTFDEDAPPAMPDCFSRDGKTPDAKSKARQSANCDSCPQNAKGSGQGDSRACRFNQSLAVVLANDMSGNVLKFQVPAASIFGKGEGDKMPLREYVTQLSTIPVNIDTVVTKMKFDLDSSSPKLFFSPVRYLTEDEYAIAQKQGKTPEAQRAIETTVAEADTAAKPSLAIPGEVPANASVAPAPRPASAPVPAPAAPVETDEEREAREFKEWKAKQAKAGKKGAKAAPASDDAPPAEPAVRAAAPAAPAPGRANIAALVEKWNAPGATDDA